MVSNENTRPSESSPLMCIHSYSYDKMSMMQKTGRHSISLTTSTKMS